MSAICGCYYLNDKKLEKERLDKMLATLSHRGPDGSDFWCES